METRAVDTLLTPSGARVCAGCGAQVHADSVKCWRCYAPLAPAADQNATKASPAYWAEQIVASNKAHGLHTATLEGFIAGAQAAAIEAFKREWMIV